MNCTVKYKNENDSNRALEQFESTLLQLKSSADSTERRVLLLQMQILIERADVFSAQQMIMTFEYFQQYSISRLPN
jgi:hypothetical protein